MVDFHSHILPNIDDGSKSFEESIALLKEAKDVGFEKVILTSHYALNCYEVPEYKRKNILDELSEEENIPKLYLGSEIFITCNISDLLEEYKASSINGTNYLLLELPLKTKFNNLRDIICGLQDKNYKIILAHPERYSIFQNDYKLLDEFRNMGILFQSNYGSILGLYGFKTKMLVKKMLKDNYISFLGSDVHHEQTIYPQVPKAIKLISKIITDDSLQSITTLNAEKLLNGEI